MTGPVLNAYLPGYHGWGDFLRWRWVWRLRREYEFTYDFRNFFHPYVPELLEVLSRRGLAGLYDPVTQSLGEEGTTWFDENYAPRSDEVTKVAAHPRNIDVSFGGPYSVYNWELLFHVPLTIAVHLSKNQRFAEAQQWFHFIFDPTAAAAETGPGRYWKFIGFRSEQRPVDLATMLALLSTPDDQADEAQLALKKEILDGYAAMERHPFHPHAVARTRPFAYEYQVVMKYLDNLLDWGDSLFAQESIDTVNEATQRYVLAANLLGPRPQKAPSDGTVSARTFAQLKAQGLDATGNVLTELEAQFPFNVTGPSSATAQAPAAAQALFGIGRTLYFCVPANEQLLAYWDKVGDRLYKIRHCINLQGVTRQLPLFDPPLDPGMLVKAAAAGIEIGSAVSGTTQPVGPLRALPMIQRTLELANEVRALGSALLASLERGDAEHLALMRQGQEIKVQQLACEVRFLQWKNAERSTEALLRARAATWERYRYYLRMQGSGPRPDERAGAPRARPTRAHRRKLRRGVPVVGGRVRERPTSAVAACASPRGGTRARDPVGSDQRRRHASHDQRGL